MESKSKLEEKSEGRPWPVVSATRCQCPLIAGGTQLVRPDWVEVPLTCRLYQALYSTKQIV